MSSATPLHVVAAPPTPPAPKRTKKEKSFRSKCDPRIASAVRSYMLRLLRRDRELTTATLTEIERAAKGARDLLILTTDVSAFEPVSGMPGMPSVSVPFGSVSPMPSMMSNLIGVSSGPMPYANPLAPSSQSETYGATVIREILAAARSFRQQPIDPAKMVEAIELAKRKKMTKLAKKLEAELFSLFSDVEGTWPNGTPERPKKVEQK